MSFDEETESFLSTDEKRKAEWEETNVRSKQAKLAAVVGGVGAVIGTGLAVAGMVGANKGATAAWYALLCWAAFSWLFGGLSVIAMYKEANKSHHHKSRVRRVLVVHIASWASAVGAAATTISLLATGVVTLAEESRGPAWAIIILSLLFAGVPSVVTTGLYFPYWRRVVEYDEKSRRALTIDAFLQPGRAKRAPSSVPRSDSKQEQQELNDRRARTAAYQRRHMKETLERTEVNFATNGGTSVQQGPGQEAPRRRPVQTSTHTLSDARPGTVPARTVPASRFRQPVPPPQSPTTTDDAEQIDPAAYPMLSNPWDPGFQPGQGPSVASSFPLGDDRRTLPSQRGSANPAPRAPAGPRPYGAHNQGVPVSTYRRDNEIASQDSSSPPSSPPPYSVLSDSPEHSDSSGSYSPPPFPPRNLRPAPVAASVPAPRQGPQYEYPAPQSSPPDTQYRAYSPPPGHEFYQPQASTSGYHPASPIYSSSSSSSPPLSPISPPPSQPPSQPMSTNRTDYRGPVSRSTSNASTATKSTAYTGRLSQRSNSTATNRTSISSYPDSFRQSPSKAAPPLSQAAGPVQYYPRSSSPSTQVFELAGSPVEPLPLKRGPPLPSARLTSAQPTPQSRSFVTSRMTNNGQFSAELPGSPVSRPLKQRAPPSVTPLTSPSSAPPNRTPATPGMLSKREFFAGSPGLSGAPYTLARDRSPPRTATATPQVLDSRPPPVPLKPAGYVGAYRGSTSPPPSSSSTASRAPKRQVSRLHIANPDQDQPDALYQHTVYEPGMKW